VIQPGVFPRLEEDVAQVDTATVPEIPPGDLEEVCSLASIISHIGADYLGYRYTHFLCRCPSKR